MRSTWRARSGRMVVVGGMVAGATIGTALPASAKGPETVTVTGPGLDEPVELSMGDIEPGGTGRSAAGLVNELAQQVEPYRVWNGTGRLEDRAPAGDLGEAYRLTWVMYGPSGADPADYTVVQDVYPDADAEGGPVVHTHASAYLDSEGGWHVAPSGLRDTLADIGAPLPGGEPVVAERRPQPAARSVAPDPAHAPNRGMLLAAGGAALLGLAALVAVTRSRRAGRLSAA
jgi:hypothetical protein